MKFFPFSCRTENSKREYYNMKIIKIVMLLLRTTHVFTQFNFFTLKKVKLSLYMPWRHIRGMEVQFHSFLTSALDGGECHALHPGHFMPWGKSTSTHWNRCWLSYRSSVALLEQRNVSYPCWLNFILIINTNGLHNQYVHISPTKSYCFLRNCKRTPVSSRLE